MPTVSADSAPARFGMAAFYARDPAKCAALTGAIDKARAGKDAAEERRLELAELMEG